jgi:hypothetical protein
MHWMRDRKAALKKVICRLVRRTHPSPAWDSLPLLDDGMTHTIHVKLGEVWAQ